MTATGSLVEACLCHVPHFITLLHALQNLFRLAHLFLSQLIDVDAFDALTHVKILVGRID